MSRHEVSVAIRQLEKEAVVVRGVRGEREQLRPQELGCAENKDVDGLAQREGVDGRDRPPDDDQRIVGAPIAAAPRKTAEGVWPAKTVP